MNDLALLDADEVARRLSIVDAADALEAALSAGLDPEADPPRRRLPVGSGELLVMPSTTAAYGRSSS